MEDKPQPAHPHIASFLEHRAKDYPDDLAVAFPTNKRCQGKRIYKQLTNQELFCETKKLCLALTCAGIEKGDRIALMVKPSLEFFSLTFALFSIGAIPVLIDPAIGRNHMKSCLKQAKPSGFIGIPKAHIARLLLGWGHRSFKHLICVGGPFSFGGKTIAKLKKNLPQNVVFKEPSAKDEAAILFTSGSTGTPKGALYRHENFLAQIRAFKATYNIKGGEKDLCTFPLFALFAPALGMAAIIPKMDFTRPGKVKPKNIFEPIEQFGISNLFGSPALLKRLAPTIKRNRMHLPSLNRIVSAGAPVPYPVIAELVAAIPPAADLFTPYGATESLPVTSIGAKEILGETVARTKNGDGICVGKPVAELSLRIIKISDVPIVNQADLTALGPEEVGEILVSGPQVTTSYFNNSKATRMAKIKDGDGKVWHRMGDVGFLDTEGRLWFCGRKSHRIRTKEGDLFTIPVESIINEHPKVKRSALVGVGRKGQETPLLWVEAKKGSPKLQQEILDVCRENRRTKSIENILFCASFPVDIRHNSKIRREKLKQEAEKTWP